MRYLITGGCGFIGSNLTSEALQRGEKVMVIDNLSRKGSEQNLAWLKTQGDFGFQQIDIRALKEVEKCIIDFQPDVIFHLAGQVAMATSLTSPRDDFEINVVAGFNILDSVRRFCANCALFYSSTNKVYGDMNDLRYVENASRYEAVDYPNGFGETLGLNFQTPYGCSKGTIDQYMLDFHRMYGLKTVVFRHSTIFGSRQFSTFDQGWVGWFMQQALNQKNGITKEPFTIAGKGKQVRDLLFIPDLVSCYFTAAEAISNTAGNVYNIGGGYKNSLSLLELFTFLESELNVELRFEETPFRKSDQKIFIANTAKAKEHFGWSPLIHKETSLLSMLDWVKRNA